MKVRGVVLEDDSKEESKYEIYKRRIVQFLSGVLGGMDQADSTEPSLCCGFFILVYAICGFSLQTPQGRVEVLGEVGKNKGKGQMDGEGLEKLGERGKIKERKKSERRGVGKL